MRWVSVDQNYNLKLYQPLIVNTDVSTSQGIHWIIIYPLQSTNVIIDPLGPDNFRPYDKDMFNQLQQYQFYNGSFQLEDSSLCGWFAMAVVKMLKQYRPTTPQAVFKLLDSYFGTDRTADANDEQVLLQFFDLKQIDEIHGSGFGDKLWSRIKGIYHYLKGDTRRGFPPKAREMIKMYGPLSISNLLVGRKPIQSMIKKVINVINLGNVRHDDLFHLRMILTMSNGVKLVFEKNETINLEMFKADPAYVFAPINLPTPLTLNQLIENTINKVGEERYFLYRATSYNCQRFVMDHLESNKIPITPQTKSFILQNVKNLVPKPFEKVADRVTDYANQVSFLTEGAGL